MSEEKDKCRDAFEDWVRSTTCDAIEDDCLERLNNADHDYSHVWTDIAWDGFKAAWNTRASPWVSCDDRHPKEFELPVLLRPKSSVNDIEVIYFYEPSEFPSGYEWAPIPEL